MHICKELKKMIKNLEDAKCRVAVKKKGFMIYPPTDMKDVEPYCLHFSERGFHPLRRWGQRIGVLDK